jgi:aminoglycoside phosphotransferase
MYCCAEHLESQKALVVLGDTYFTFKSSWTSDNWGKNNEPDDVPMHSFILTAPVRDSYRWCMVGKSDGHATSFIDKPALAEASMEAAIGVYGFDDVELLKLCLDEAVADVFTDGESPTAPIQMSDVLRPYLGIAPIEVRAPGEWMDCGNADNLAQSHQRLLQQRAFNEVSIDSQLGIFSKRSKYTTKFVDEINYYKLLPPKLSVLFPRVIESSIELKNEFLNLEYYGYPTLAELWLYENLHTRIWEQIFIRLKDLLDNPMAAYRREIPPEDYRQMYLDKPRERSQMISKKSVLGSLINNPNGVTVNGVHCPSFSEVMSDVEQMLPEFAADGRQGIIHGDMCFSNVLYDLRSRICKFIDPRGSFGQSGIFGDQKYDVAKLYHSVIGLYDFLVNDLFSVSLEGLSISLDVRNRQEHMRVQEVFNGVFFPGFNQHHIQMITGLLFLSMPALHYDRPLRQLAMYATGMRMIADAQASKIKTVSDSRRQLKAGNTSGSRITDLRTIALEHPLERIVWPEERYSVE